METTSGEEPLTELSVDEAVSIAVQLHQRGFLDEAQTVYERILKIEPDQADAMHFLGVLLHQRDRSDAAIDLIEKSIALAPQVPDRYNNLGNVLVERERLAEATEAYERAIALQPAHANAFNNLGAVLKAQGRMDEAAAAYMRAIALDPKHVEAHNNMGSLLESQGAHREACAYYCKALTLMPDNPNAKKLLGVAYYTLGEIDKAAEVFRQWLAEDPGNPVASHMHAACSGENVPLRASDDYIETTFDNFADSFDAKLGYLGYRAPQAVAQAVAQTLGAPAKRLVALDAGCGTGLCGPLLAPYVSRLTGVDLSAAMLAKARSRGVYDELVKAELTAYLNAHADAFDLIVSADTLVYFGPLEAVFGATSVSLRGHGLLAFTLEEAAADVAKDGYRINPHGRYSHTRRYVSQALMAAGFAALSIEPTTLRMEGGAPVAGLVVSARKDRGIGLQSMHGRV